jgi:hypothetical protein
MKFFRTAAVVAALAFGWLAGCNDYNTSIQYNTGPQIGNYAPTGVVAGSGSFLLTVNVQFGQAFASNSVIQWNGQKQTTTFVDATTLTATIDESLVTNPSANHVNVLTPQSGTGNNGLSNTVNVYAFSSTPNPLPTITNVTPGNAPACGSNCGGVSVKITVTGTNFLPASNNGGTLVTFQDALTTLQQPTVLTISNYTGTSLTATIPGTFLANPDTGVISVTNPPNLPGGGQCPNLTCVQLAGGGTSVDSYCFAIGTGTGQICPSTSAETPAITQDGRYVAYASQQNGINQILLKDTCLGVANGCKESSQVISAAADGTAGNQDSHNAVITPDGRYVAFSSAATNLAEGAASGRQVYIRDTCIGEAGDACKPSTTLISTDPGGLLNGTESILPSISTSGRFVAFVAVTASNANTKTGTANAVQSSPNSGMRQVFLRDTCLGAANCTPKTTRISMMPGDAPATGGKAAGPAISGLAKQIALNDGHSATVFAPTVPVDDGVFVAVPKEQ